MVAFADNLDPLVETGRASLLLVEDDAPVRDLLVRILANEYDVFAVEDCQAAEKLLQEEAIDVIICDHGLPGESGLDFLSRIRALYPYIQRILLTGQTDVDLAIRAINEGDVHRYLPKPAEFSTVCEAVNTGLEKRKQMLSEKRIAEENAAMKDRMNSLPYTMHRMRVLGLEGGRFMARAMGIYLIGSLGFLVCGVGLLLVLYVIKTVIGVNMLSLNLEEVVAHFHNWARGLGGSS